MGVIINGIGMSKECQNCKLHINEKNDDYGWRCECLITGTTINLLSHQKPLDCPIKCDSKQALDALERERELRLNLACVRDHIKTDGTAFEKRILDLYSK